MLFVMFIQLMFVGSILGGGVYFLLRFVRALEHRGGASSELVALRDRVAALEAAHDEVRSEMRHLTEGQEFTARLLEAKPVTGNSAT